MGFVAKGLVSIPFKKEEEKKRNVILFHSHSPPSLPLSCPSLFPPKVFIDSAEKEKKKKL